MWIEKLTFGDLIDRAAERWREREALWFEGRRWTFAEQRDEVDRAAKALIAAGVGARRSRLPVARQPARVRLPLLRRRQDRRRAGADQHPLSHPRHGVRRDAVGRDDADRRRPRARRRLPGDDRGAVARVCAAAAGALACDAAPALRRVILLGDGGAGHARLARRCCAPARGVTDAELARAQRRRRSRRHRLHHVHVGHDRLSEGRDAGPQRRPQHLRQRQPARRDAATTSSSTICRSSTPSPSTRRCSCRRPPARATCSWRTFDAGEALRLIEAERATMINGFDTHYKDLLEHPSRGRRATCRACAPASAPPACCRASRSRAAPRSLMRTMTGYGMTEIGVGVTGSFLDTDEETRVTMSGWPLPGYEIKIIDPGQRRRRCRRGSVGEICVRGYQVMQGYYKKPEETAQDHRCRRLAAHRRQRSAARRRLPALPRPLQGSAQGRRRERRPDRGREPAARRSAHQPRRRRRRARPAPAPRCRSRSSSAKPAPASASDDVVAVCRGRIASFKIPRHVFFVDAFPMTGSGKIQKYLLRERAQQG